MVKNNNAAEKILIVDDSEMNRVILSEMLGDEYEIIEAENGAQAVQILQKQSVEISLVLLDIVMPVMDGYEVLEIMNSKRWIEDVPVIMISAESSPSSIEKAYNLGVVDFISRPFDALIVRRRVVNTLLIYSKQKKLEEMVAEQIYEKEKNSNLMITILSHIVEFRNGESGLHVLHVQMFTEILLKRLVQITDKYNLSEDDITLISNAAALHDIGKISIPDEILNKPGRLSDEEFAIMKTHSAVGAEMIDEMPFYKDEPLVKVAYEICRWHHERYDGRGYPDRLSGDEIPISAQIVAMADVYDALTSERVYKKAFTHEVAMNMILGGECGAFNPLLLQCLKDSAKEIQDRLSSFSKSSYIDKDIKTLENEVRHFEELSSSKRTLNMLNIERTKNEFFSTVTKERIFEYTASPSTLTLSQPAAKELGLDSFIINPLKDEKFMALSDADEVRKISELIRSSTPQEPVAECEMTVNGGEGKKIKVTCRSIWSSDKTPQYIGAIGIFEKL